MQIALIYQLTNVLTFKEAPDFETKSSYSITLSLTDGTETVTKDISIAVTNVNAVSGSELEITSAGVLTFASAPDYETKSSYTATVTASDSTNSTTQAITVNVTDVNEAPAFTSSATFSAAENQTTIGTVAASDADGDTITYSISGSDITINSSVQRSHCFCFSSRL